LPINGFDLGNSPAEYTAESVGGKIVVFTTTNGTKAIRQCRHAEHVWIGCAGNIRAVCDRLATCDEAHLVCAGTEGQITRDDALIAGAIVDRLMGPESACEPDDVARLVRAAWRNVRAASMARGMGLPHHLAVELEDTRGGRNLLAIGHADDLAIAARIDCFEFVPVLDRETGRIVRG
jgi:2-phosphosulfolactate phosphatase